MRICVVDTVYCLFLYILKFGYNEDDFFIFSDGIPESIKDNISHYYFPGIRFDINNDFSFLKKIRINIIPLFRLFYEVLKLRLILFFKTRNKDFCACGQGHLNSSFPLYECENNAIIEDGIGNYLDLQKTTKFNPVLEVLFHFLGFYSFRIYEGFGTHDNIKKIYLTKEGAPEIVKDKVELFNPEEIWQSKSIEEQNKILKLFNVNFLNDFEESITILLTEPFSEENIIPFDEEINIYTEEIEKYPNIVIKPHPRETKNYKNLFPNNEVIDVPFPVEIFKYLGKDIKKLVTFGSTAALNFEGYCEIEVYDKKTSSSRINDSCLLLKEKLK